MITGRIGVLVMAACLAGPSAAGQEEPPLSEVIGVLGRFQPGDAEKPLRAVEALVARATGDPALRRRVADGLVAILTHPGTSRVAKVFICGQLPLVASDEHVGRLATLLAEPDMVEPARRALAAIPGETSGKVLRHELTESKGLALVGVINSLGDRRDAKAAEALAGLVSGPDAAVAQSAARALGEIGTAEAAAALAAAKAPAGLLPAFLDAQLRCAERRAAAGDAAGADALYRQVWASSAPPAVRIAGLAGLVEVGGERALGDVLKAMGADDPLLKATALRLAGQVAGAKATAALVERLAGLSGGAKAELIAVLADRGDRAAAPAVAGCLNDADESARLAAVEAMASLGDASAVAPLLDLAAAGAAPLQAAARRSLDRLAATDVDPALLDAAAQGGAPRRAEAIRALAARRTRGAETALTKLTADADEAVRVAALESLGILGGAECYPRLVELVVSGPSAGTRDAAERAAAAVGARLADRAARARPLLDALAKAPAAARPGLLRLLGACGGDAALAGVRACTADADADVVDAAVRALAAWPDTAAAEDLLAIARDCRNNVHRALAMRGYLRLARTSAGEAAERLKMLQRAKEVAAGAADRRMLLAALADLPDADALGLATSLLDDPEVRTEAALAALKIAEALVKTDAAAAKAAMQQIQAKVTDENLLARAKAVQAARPRRGGGGGGQDGPALRPDKARSDAARKELAKRAPEGYRLACYLDCGPDDVDGASGAPTLRSLGGAKHQWPGSDAAADARFGTVRFDTRQVAFEAAGLDPRRSYRVGFSWWDYDHNTRVQSVWASAGGPAAGTQLLKATKLPSGAAGAKPAEHTLDLPRELTATGKAQVTFRNDGAPNVVVSEIWLWESEATSEPPGGAAAPAAPAPAGAAAALAPSGPGGPGAATKPADQPAPEPKPFRPGKKGEKRVLIVTGIDYPGHKWRQTTPVLAAALDKDPRLTVDVVESPAFLRSSAVHGYDCLVLHFMNWQTPGPGPEAQDHLLRFVGEGKGLVLVHFACGAFQEWPGFAKLAGRAWNPKLRGHDPHGAFRVNIVDGEHPITKGMAPFETRDELYTCLAGDTPIHVIAAATSKVDKKDYPMAFVLNYGKGRVFHSVLGHDVGAFGDAVCELYRRAAAWAAGLP